MDPSSPGATNAVREPLPPGFLEALERPDAYPHDSTSRAGVHHVQTHLSHVFLTRARVYKLRKAVRLEFVDFGTRAARNADCLREIALNRRLAPDVYLGVAPIEGLRARARVGAVSEDLRETAEGPLEHCVVMRRLPDGRDARSLLEAGRLRPRHVDAVVRRLAAFHAQNSLGRPAPFDAGEWVARVRGPVEENLRALEAVAGRLVPRPAVARLAARARGFLEENAARFERRREDGRAVDGHGDVHLEHVWFERDDAAPLLIDCIEFREDFRRIDAASDVAFLAMDLAYRGRRGLAERALRVYAAESDDFDLYGVVDYYASYRAAVRAKVAAIAAADAGIDAAQREAAARSARRHVAGAARWLAPRRRAALVIVAGVVGTGKSTAAAVLADSLAGVVIASDRVRKRQAGLAPSTRAAAAPGEGIYTRERSERTYRGLLERAEPVLASGRVAVLDATFALAQHRAEARGFAAAHGVPFVLVEVRCAESVALERLARRERRGGGASDAGPSLYETSRAAFQPVRGGDAERGTHLVVRTDEGGWRARLRAAARRIRS